MIRSAVCLLALLGAACASGDVGRQTPDAAALAAAAEARETNANRPTRWWEDLSKKSASWYRTDEAAAIARNILSWQDPELGGWPLMNTIREENRGDPAQAGPWGVRPALIKATVNEIRFLACAHQATENETYSEAALRGLEFIYAAQYESGGWPHSYPLRDDYSRYATYNDDEMPDLMALLQEVTVAPEFAFVGREGRARAKAAFDRGVDFVLKSQIRVDGRLTAWGQQHDEITYEPRPARAFEPVAISGGESASVLHMLMEIREPSDEVKAAIEAGVQWYRDVQIDGLRLIREDGDREVVADPDARPMWARFYEIETMRPIFQGRDGVRRYAMAEIEKERRGGYAWYNYSGTAVFEHYDRWKQQRRWDDQPPTNTDEAAVGDYALPPIMEMASGAAVRTVAQWERQRRPEIMGLLAQYQQGVTPSGDAPVEVEVFEEDGVGLGGVAKRRQVRIGFPGNEEVGPIRVLLYTPADADGPVPTLLHFSFTPNVQLFDEPGMDEGMAWSAALRTRVPDRDATFVGGFDAKSLVERGNGVAIIYYGDIFPDFNHGNAHGVPLLFDAPKTERAADEWGAIGAWSWGLSRVMDYLVTDDRVDADKVALSGVSRLGKSVLWAAAQDQRFAAVIPLLSGEGGAAISRRNYGETIADLTNPRRYPYWYAPRYQDYAFKVDDLPVDGHMLLAMIAPRPVLQIVGTEDTWSDPMGEYVSAKAAEVVWDLYDKTTPLGAFPAPDKAVLGDMSFLLHEGGHTTLPIDIETMADFLDLHFRD